MMTNNDKLLVYDTLLSAPGMAENVKITLNVNRIGILLLSQLIESGLKQKDELLAFFPTEASTELSTLLAECLEKAALKPLSDKLKSLK